LDILTLKHPSSIRTGIGIRFLITVSSKRQGKNVDPQDDDSLRILFKQNAKQKKVVSLCFKTTSLFAMYEN